MNFVGKRKLVGITEKLHLRIFGHDMSNEMRAFLNNLSWSFFGGGIASLILFMVAVSAARLLGPSEFGKYSIIIAITEILLIIIIFGTDIGSIKLLSSSSKNKNKVISSSLIITIITIFIVCVVFFMSHKYIEYINNFDTITSLIIIISSVVFGIKRMGDSYMRGLMMFKNQAKYKIMEAVCVILLFPVLFFAIGISNYFAYIGTIIVSSGFISFLYFKRYVKYFSKKDISKKYSKKILSYSTFGIIASITGVIVQSFDKLVIYKYFELASVGVYSVYYMISLLAVSQIIQIVINVFLPTMKEEIEKKNIYKKINNLYRISFLPGVIFFIFFIRMTLFLFGSEYEIFWNWIVILSFFSVIHFFTSLYGWTLISISREGYKKQNIGLIAGTFGYIITIVIGISILGLKIEIFFIALVVSRLISGLLYKFFISKLL